MWISNETPDLRVYSTITHQIIDPSQINRDLEYEVEGKMNAEFRMAQVDLRFSKHEENSEHIKTPDTFQLLPETNPSYHRGLLSSLVESLPPIPIIISGTKLHLTSLKDVQTSALYKNRTAHKIIEFPFIQNSLGTINQYLNMEGVSEKVLDNVAYQTSGRLRNTFAFIKKVYDICRKKDQPCVKDNVITEALKQCLQELKTFIGRSISVLESQNIAYKRYLFQLVAAGKLTPRVEFPHRPRFDPVNSGICFLSEGEPDNNGLSRTKYFRHRVLEPSVIDLISDLLAAEGGLFRDYILAFKKLVAELNKNPKSSTKGDLFVDAIAAYLVSLEKKHTTFRQFLEPFSKGTNFQIPNWCGDAQFTWTQYGKASTLGYPGVDKEMKEGAADFQYISSFEDNDTKLLVPHNMTRPDILGYTHDPQSFLYELLLGGKFYTGRVDQETIKDNINSTRPTGLFNKNRRPTNAAARDRFQKLDMPSKLKGCLRIAVALFVTIGPKMARIRTVKEGSGKKNTKREDVLLLVDLDNIHHLLPQTAATALKGFRDALKNDSEPFEAIIYDEVLSEELDDEDESYEGQEVEIKTETVETKEDRMDVDNNSENKSKPEDNQIDEDKSRKRGRGDEERDRDQKDGSTSTKESDKNEEGGEERLSKRQKTLWLAAMAGEVYG